MFRKKKLIKYAFLYLLNIFIFSIIYLGFWVKNTNNFIINENYNELTIKPVFFFDEIPDSLENARILTTKETNELLIPEFDKLKHLKVQLKSLDSSLSVDNRKLEKQSKILWQSREKNLQGYLEKKLLPFNKIKDSINKVIGGVKSRQKNISKNDQQYYDVEVKIAKAKYQQSLNDVSIAKMTAKVYTEGLDNFQKFNDEKLTKSQIELSNKISESENRKSSVLDDIRKSKEAVRVIAMNYHFDRYNRVGFTDFIYFSVITATSTGYGDILPNSRYIRFFVSLEILISLVLFGLFLYWLTAKEEM